MGALPPRSRLDRRRRYYNSISNSSSSSSSSSSRLPNLTSEFEASRSQVAQHRDSLQTLHEQAAALQTLLDERAQEAIALRTDLDSRHADWQHEHRSHSLSSIESQAKLSDDIGSNCDKVEQQRVTLEQARCDISELPSGIKSQAEEIQQLRAELKVALQDEVHAEGCKHELKFQRRAREIQSNSARCDVLFNELTAEKSDRSTTFAEINAEVMVRPNCTQKQSVDARALPTRTETVTVGSHTFNQPSAPSSSSARALPSREEAEHDEAQRWPGMFNFAAQAPGSSDARALPSREELETFKTTTLCGFFNIFYLTPVGASVDILDICVLHRSVSRSHKAFRA